MKNNLKIAALFALCTLGIFFHTARSDASASSLLVMKGQSKTIDVEYPVGDIAVADPGVCDYFVAKNRRQIYVNGKMNGETLITIWDVDGNQKGEFSVRVVSTTLKEVLDHVRQNFGDLKGIDVSVINGRVEIGGKVFDPEDFRRIETLARSDQRIRSRIRLTGDIIDKVVEAIRESMDVPGVTVRAVRDKVVLEGVAYSATDRKRAVEIAKLYYPEVLDLIDVKDTGRRAGQGDLIELEFHMMEIKKSALKQFGVNWAPGSFPANGSANAGTGSGAGFFSSIGNMGKSLIGFVFQLVPKLKFVRQCGDGRVLENPSIIVKDGEKAQIFSGTEVPYYKGDEVQFKRMGIDITAEPIKVKGGIDLKISATLSAPSADIRGAIDTNTVSTTAICKFGQSLVLSNIVRNGDVKMKNRVPRGVDTSSALFTLFLSKDFQSNRSEFVIFVTPKIVKQPTHAEAKLKDFLAAEETMILDRSRKEYEEHMKGVGKEVKKPRRRGRKRKWR